MATLDLHNFDKGCDVRCDGCDSQPEALVDIMLSLASFSPQLTHSGQKQSYPSIKPKVKVTLESLTSFFDTDESSAHLIFS